MFLNVTFREPIAKVPNSDDLFALLIGRHACQNVWLLHIERAHHHTLIGTQVGKQLATCKSSNRKSRIVEDSRWMRNEARVHMQELAARRPSDEPVLQGPPR